MEVVSLEKACCETGRIGGDASTQRLGGPDGFGPNKKLAYQRRVASSPFLKGSNSPQATEHKSSEATVRKYSRKVTYQSGAQAIKDARIPKQNPNRKKKRTS